jgi:hypothetical protein
MHLNVIYDIPAKLALSLPLRLQLNGNLASFIHIHTDSAYMTTACSVEWRPLPSLLFFNPILFKQREVARSFLPLLRY